MLTINIKCVCRTFCNLSADFLPVESSELPRGCILFSDNKKMKSAEKVIVNSHFKYAPAEVRIPDKNAKICDKFWIQAYRQFISFEYRNASTAYPKRL